jgi:hypothetical protein
VDFSDPDLRAADFFFLKQNNIYIFFDIKQNNIHCNSKFNVFKCRNYPHLFPYFCGGGPLIEMGKSWDTDPR